ncbi:MAG: DNA polymerase I, partial [Clostridia bacterium]|nr:DNA polymerase I [Clostridia bacterium]
LTRVLDELELPLIPVLFECERVGFKINVGGMLDFAEALDKLANELKERLYIQALGEFNINSPKQLGEVLFVKLGLPCKKKKNKNGFSTDAETLEELRQYSPIIDDILEYRQVTKLHGTYANALPRLVDENDRIHTDFKQALTATGRLSSADPNLQNIPIRTAMGREMRRYFIAREGYTLVDADYSQIELRLLSHMSDDYNMKNAFIHNEDIHRKTAAAVFGIPEEFVTDDMRKRAKAVNFGIVYGISGFSLAKDIGTTSAEATRYIKNYLMNYPGIDSYLERVVEDARANGYTVTEFGRRRYIPELRAANGMQRQLGKRIAMNAPIQGTAADVMKLAMIRVYERLKRDVPDAKIVMQVHDELVVECPDTDRELVAGILKEEMERAVKLSVPLTVDVTSGKNWLQQS